MELHYGVESWTTYVKYAQSETSEGGAGMLGEEGADEENLGYPDGRSNYLDFPVTVIPSFQRNRNKNLQGNNAQGIKGAMFPSSHCCNTPITEVIEPTGGSGKLELSNS